MTCKGIGMRDVKDLALIIDAGVPIIIVETQDELRALELLTQVAIKQQLGFSRWSITEGLKQAGFSDELELLSDPESPTEVLKKIKQTKTPSLFALCDFHPYLVNNPEHVRLLKDIALGHSVVPHSLILLSYELTVPPELQHYSARFAFSLPSEAQLMSIVREEVESWSKENANARIKTDHLTLKKLIKNLSGLSRQDSRRLIRSAIRDDGAITESDLPEINKAKFELIDMDGVLSFEYDTEKFSAVGGLNNLKKWLKEREAIFLNAQSVSADRPKGVMLLGIQGGGKSLAAKSVAGLWGVPLLRLDMAALYNKFIGETEKNLSKSLAQAELMSPCVLWIDEIEKGLATSHSDDSTTRRILGTLLTWMAERESSVFVVATANDVSQLPPELMRKGRMDETFFVDLPKQKVREEIFSIHIEKRNFNAENFDLSLLASQSNGFSGAEIEQAVVAALYSASAQRQPMLTEHIVDQLERTYPLSVVMAEKVSQLRSWAENRTVSAD
jgi:SpoVK/Ycf46/Vps4 family AAA+-type ATPase